MKRRAFSKIEFLVVLGVLAGAAALVFPVFVRTKEDPRDSSCQNNLKQISLGFKQYINDFDERYPLVISTKGSPNGVPPYGWADALQPYIKSTQVFHCYSHTAGGNGDPRAANYTDYWYNANFVCKVRRGAKVIMIGAEPHYLGYESHTVIVGDGGNSDGAPTGDARYNHCGDGSSLVSATQTCPMEPAGPATLSAAQIHDGGANYAFADGHVKWLRGETVTHCAQVLNNGLTRGAMEQAANAGNVTMSLLSK